MTQDKPTCMAIAKQYGEQYWDGDRRFGYGGYRYDGRWQPVAEAMISHYKLKEDHRILDIGCGKAFLLSDIKTKLKWVKAQGCDISSYALRQAPDNVRMHLKQANCTNLPYADNSFDFVYSIGCLHNLGYSDLKQAISELVRVLKPDSRSYVCVESYRNDSELMNLQAWALTAKSFYDPHDWKDILWDNGYRGDIEFIGFS